MKITCVGAVFSEAAALKLLMGSSSGAIRFFTLLNTDTTADLTAPIAEPKPPPIPSQSGRQMPASRPPMTSSTTTTGINMPPRRVSTSSTSSKS